LAAIASVVAIALCGDGERRFLFAAILLVAVLTVVACLISRDGLRHSGLMMGVALAALVFAVANSEVDTQIATFGTGLVLGAIVSHDLASLRARRTSAE